VSVKPERLAEDEESLRQMALDPDFGPGMDTCIAINNVLDALDLYRRIFRHLTPETSRFFFICGEAGPHDSQGLPEKIFVCPTYGLDGFTVYSKTSDYSAPGW
jgi:hypothetical protein